jgi:phosphate transport system protein
MRDAYHDELDALMNSLVEMLHLVGGAMARATQALLDADLTLAEQVIDGDEAVDALFHDVERRALDLMARQQPVASDLRTLITSLRMVADLERAGDNATKIAQIARRRYPGCAIPDELHSTILEMGQIAQRVVAKVSSALAARDVELAREIEREDDAMDDLHRSLFRRMLDDHWDHGVECAIDVSFAGRYYERFADHAVSVARRMVFLVTGEQPEPIAG